MGEVRYGLTVTGFQPHKDHLWALECSCRNVRRLLETLQAREALAIGDKEQLAELYDAIQDISSDRVKKILRKILRGRDLESKTAMELRVIASGLRIHNYSRMTKDQMIYHIEKRRKALQRDGKRVGGQDEHG